MPFNPPAKPEQDSACRPASLQRMFRYLRLSAVRVFTLVNSRSGVLSFMCGEKSKGELEGKGETMKKSEQINELAAALSKAQGQIKNAAKDSANPFFKSKYADLASVWDACRAELSANGLAVVQVPESRDGQVGVYTILLHSSGQWVDGELFLTPVKDDPQGAGSIITYCRRYSLCGFAGIAPEDDDGNAASGKDANKPLLNVERTKEEIPVVGKTASKGSHILPPTDELIDTGQQKKLHMRFRESLDPQYQPAAEGLLNDFLGSKLIMDDHGNPSVKGIRKDEFASIGKEAVHYAKTYVNTPKELV